MCGICGSVGLNIDISKMEVCCNRLYHRGPDGGNVVSADNDVLLGHRRLAIIDLSDDGKQPMSYANGRYWITFNGEIYNYIEIKSELVQKGYSFKSNSDTEVILAAYAEWNDKCVERFNGMWALAIYDKTEHSIFISRDRFGIKPLFYSEMDGGLVFASEMKAIKPLLRQQTINKSLISFYTYFHHYEFMKQCLIKEIKRLPAGCNAYYSGGKLTIKRWWNTLDHLMEVPADYADRVGMFRDLFMDACRLRMRSDVTIGTSLSGGLDSSAVICAMKYISDTSSDSTFNRNWQHAYVARFPGCKNDEGTFAQMVTDYLGIESTFLDIADNTNPQNLYELSYQFEELWMNSQIPMMDIYRQERRDGTVVSLDGHGADELFGGYDFDVRFALLDAATDEEKLEICKTMEAADEAVAVAGTSNMNKKLREVRLKNVWDKAFRRLVIKSEFLNQTKYSQLDNLNKTLLMQTHEKILPTLLRNYDRDSMASGVEIRMPFMDYRIVEFAFSIPWRDKIHNGYTKAIIRDALSPVMPEDIAYRKSKIGFNAPLHEWIRKDKEQYLDIVLSADFANCRTVDNPGKVRKSIEKVINHKGESWRDDNLEAQRAWNAINLYFWEKGFFEEKGYTLER